MKSNWRIGIANASIVVIEDVGPWDTFATITNAAEETVIDFIVQHPQLADHRLFWVDTEGRVDELRHDGRRFTGFAVGPGKPGCHYCKGNGWYKYNICAACWRDFK